MLHMTIIGKGTFRWQPGPTASETGNGNFSCLSALAQRRSGVHRPEDFWCCQGRLIQAHTVYPNHIFYEEGENLVLSQYIPCQLDWNKNGTSIKFTLTENLHLDAHHRPSSQSYELKITCAQPQEFTDQVPLALVDERQARKWLSMGKSRL